MRHLWLLAVLMVLVAAPAFATARSTYVMNESPTGVTIFFRAGSRAVVEDVASRGKRIVPWDDYGLKSVQILIRGCGREHVLNFEPTTVATVLFISGDQCTPHLQNGNR